MTSPNWHNMYDHLIGVCLSLVVQRNPGLTCEQAQERARARAAKLTEAAINEHMASRRFAAGQTDDSERAEQIAQELTRVKYNLQGAPGTKGLRIRWRENGEILAEV
jgi:hypothetical protein